jgi:hypothetical protein
MWDARAVRRDGSSPRKTPTVYWAVPDDFLASYLSCRNSSLADCLTHLGKGTSGKGNSGNGTSGKGTSFSAQGLM